MYNTMPPPWMWGGYNPTPPASPTNPVDMITQWQRSLDELKKAFKEEKKDVPKKNDRPAASVISMMLLMLLLSPITGPCMYAFFQLSLALIHK